MTLTLVGHLLPFGSDVDKFCLLLVNSTLENMEYLCFTGLPGTSSELLLHFIKLISKLPCNKKPSSQLQNSLLFSNLFSKPVQTFPGGSAWFIESRTRKSMYEYQAPPATVMTLFGDKEGNLTYRSNEIQKRHRCVENNHTNHDREHMLQISCNSHSNC